jgi:hypothetical protein
MLAAWLVAFSMPCIIGCMQIDSRCLKLEMAAVNNMNERYGSRRV